jgi:uncharacterized protein YndB with AHSA1/START domain
VSIQQRDTSDREIVQERVFDAPRELVFRAFTQVEHLHHWWGPNGFSTSTSEHELRPGGQWVFIMHGPDGRDYVNRVVYTDIEPPARLAWLHRGEEGNPVQFHVEVLFEELDGKTRLTMRSVLPSAAERQRVIDEVDAIEGGRQTLQRLADYLETLR